MGKSTHKAPFPEPVEGNHEIWTECPCGCIFDARLNGTVCPQCGRIITLNRTLKLIGAMCIVVILLLLFGACTPLKYHCRQRSNHKAQQVQQYQSSRCSLDDPMRSYRNWDRRPQNHWPFNFLR